MSGDAVSGDGLFSDNTGYFNQVPSIGPRTLRFKAELLGADGSYHASAVDVSPFFVVAQAPAGPPPAIVAISPDAALAGTQLTITGSGFDPIATNNVVLIGNQLAIVIGVNPAGTQLVVVVPSGGALGLVPVTVSSLGQTSSAATITVLDANASVLTVKMVAGLDIVGTVGMTYRIDYLGNIADTNSWVPLTNLTLSASPYFWVDITSTNQPKRFYRSVRIP